MNANVNVSYLNQTRTVRNTFITKLSISNTANLDQPATRIPVEKHQSIMKILVCHIT